jgi:hypothetical protein
LRVHPLGNLCDGHFALVDALLDFVAQAGWLYGSVDDAKAENTSKRGRGGE